MRRNGATRVGVLGGTFDPIHHVHLQIAREAVRVLDLDTVLFVPTGQPSHRRNGRGSRSSDRCAMVRAAVDGEERLAISTVDVERPKRTYTVDTLLDLRAVYGPAAELYFIVGADNLRNVLRWHRSAELLRLARFVGSSRLGFPLVDPGFPRGRLTLMYFDHAEISATDIRRLVRAGRSIDGLTPDPVTHYIRAHGLYAPARIARTFAERAPLRADRTQDRVGLLG
jgi:nicotinate-nucleotide adenylyltransferase